MSAPEQGTAEAKGSRRSSTTLILALIAVGVIVLGAITVALLHHSDTSGDRTGAVTPTPGPAPATTGEGQTGFAVPDVDAFGRRVDIPNNPMRPTARPDQRPTRGHRSGMADRRPDPARARRLAARVRGVGAVLHLRRAHEHDRRGAGRLLPHPARCRSGSGFTTWEAYARPGDWTLRERMEVMTDADHAEFDRLQAAGKVPAQAPVAATRWLVAPDAFQIESFSATGDLCVLKIATKAPPASAGGPAQWQASQLTMVWDGQWRLRLAPGGHLPGSTIGSLDGWTRW